MKKKFFIITLLLCLCVASLMGCNKTKSNNAANTEATEDSSDISKYVGIYTDDTSIVNIAKKEELPENIAVADEELAAGSSNYYLEILPSEKCVFGIGTNGGEICDIVYVSDSYIILNKNGSAYYFYPSVEESREYTLTTSYPIYPNNANNDKITMIKAK